MSALFQDLPLFQAHQQTSVDAYRRIRVDAESLRGRVLALLLRARANGIGGLTDEEIQMALEMNPSTERPRRIELQSAGLVVDSGIRRPTRSGRLAVVWSAA